MAEISAKFGYLGMVSGSAALLVALIHFFGGPFAPQPSLEQSIAEKAVAIRDATVSALQGKEIEKQSSSADFDLDRILMVFTAALGGLALILGVVGYVRSEPLRAAVGAGLLGGAAIGFQFAAIALAAIVFAIILGAVLSVLDFG